jgi:hypothetical protein
VGNTIVYLDRRERLGLVSISESGGWSAPVSLGVPTPREFVVVTPTSRGREHVISIDGNGQIWHSHRGGPHERWRSQNLHLEGPRLPLMRTRSGIAAWRISDLTPVVFVCTEGANFWSGGYLAGHWITQLVDAHRILPREFGAGFDGSTVFALRDRTVLRLYDIFKPNWEFSLAAFIGTPELDFYEP